MHAYLKDLKAYLQDLSVFRILVLFITLFLIFTPFENRGTYLAVLGPRLMILLCVLLLLSQIKRPLPVGLRPATIFLACMFVHMTFIVPIDFMQLGVEWFTLIACALLARFFAIRLREAICAIDALLLVNCLGFALQLSWGIVGGGFLDLHSVLFPGSITRVGHEHFGFTRYGGFHIEPGTYSTWMAMLVALSRLAKGRFSWIELASIVTIIATYSTAGAIYFAVFIIWHISDNKKILRARTVGAIMLATCIAIPALYILRVDEYLTSRLLGEGYSDDWRLDAKYAYTQLPLMQKLIGFGHGEEICYNCHFDDLGFLPNMLMRGGVIGAVAVLLLFVSLHRYLGLRQTLFFLFIVGSAKAPTNNPGPWLVLLIVSEIAHYSVRRQAGARRSRDPNVAATHGNISLPDATLQSRKHPRRTTRRIESIDADSTLPTTEVRILSEPVGHETNVARRTRSSLHLPVDILLAPDNLPDPEIASDSETSDPSILQPENNRTDQPSIVMRSAQPALPR